jgi:hypothetical protein
MMGSPIALAVLLLLGWLYFGQAKARLVCLVLLIGWLIYMIWLGIAHNADILLFPSLVLLLWLVLPKK